MESAAGGLICALLLAQRLREEPLTPPPPTTALGGICTHLARKVERYQPSNITWAHLPPLGDRRLKKRDRYGDGRAGAGGSRGVDAPAAARRRSFRADVNSSRASDCR